MKTWTRANIVGLAAVIAVSLGVRGAWVAVVHALPVSDFLFYYLGAASIAAGHGYSILGHPTSFFPIGYPAFLALLFTLFGTSLTVVRVSGVLLWTLSAGLAYLLGLRLGKGLAPALIGGLIVALYPDFVMLTGLAASENLMVPLLLGVSLLLSYTAPGRISVRTAALAGVLLGASLLVRSTAILFVPLVALVIVVAGRDRRRVLAAIALLATCAAVVLPWVVRNWAVMGTADISTNGGYTLFLGLNSRATGGTGVRGYHHAWPIQSVRSEVAANSELTHRALDWALHHPLGVVRLMPKKAYFLFHWTPGQLLSNFRAQPGGVTGAIMQRSLTGSERALFRWLTAEEGVFAWIQYVFLVVASAGLVLALLRKLPAALWVALTFAYWIIFHVTLIHGQARFLKSVTPLLAPFAGYALVAAATWLVFTLRRPTPSLRGVAAGAAGEVVTTAASDEPPLSGSEGLPSSAGSPTRGGDADR